MEREWVIKVLKLYVRIDKEIQFSSRIINDLKDVYNKDDVHDQVLKMINEMQNRNEEFFRLKMEILREINTLDIIQKTILFEFYVQQRKWADVVEKVNYCERQCRRERSKAIGKLGEKFDKNRIIHKYVYS